MVARFLKKEKQKKYAISKYGDSIINLKNENFTVEKILNLWNGLSWTAENEHLLVHFDEDWGHSIEFKKRILCFDVETDGLYGKPIAFGFVVMDEVGNLIHEKGYRIPLKNVKNKWVQENVVPYIQKIDEVKNEEELLELFWENYMYYKKGAIIVADFQAPVETNFIRKCIVRDLEARQFLGPYPLHELGTLFLCQGLDPDMNRLEFLRNSKIQTFESQNIPHNPICDALQSALCWIALTTFKDIDF